MTVAERCLAEAEALIASVRVALLEVEPTGLAGVAAGALNVGLAQALRGDLDG